ncbi:MAG TPA: hypothetical protein PKA77_16310 [Chitinophagaceae bacterium]|nr:hypothetical protein [Chitinophagaceae bacterium]HMU59269.1 hypothetical protein [Chitinophagaceae bacterium]
MKTKKMSLAAIQGKLSRAEMKNVVAGVQAICVEEDRCGYKCCWENDMNNCSECQPGARPICVSGAKAVGC